VFSSASLHFSNLITVWSSRAARDPAIFISTFFERFRTFLNDEFHSLGGSYAVEFDAISMPCTLVSHTTGTFRGVSYRCSPLRFGVRTPR
jgi:hypothetical protein